MLFTDDAEIHILNKTYRNKDKATDVLSFPHAEAGERHTGHPFLGDLVISLDTTKRQARQYKVTFGQELLRLLIHGTLHLFGYDHEKVPKSKAAAMRRKEKQLFGKYKPFAREFL